MTQVAFSSSFKRAFKKRIEGRKELEQKFWRRVEIFIANPHDSRLRTHKLSGELREQWSFTVEYDVRVVFSSFRTTAPCSRTLAATTKFISVQTLLSSRRDWNGLFDP